MTQIKIHWSFWLVCVVALIWNLLGSINFITQMQPELLANYPDAAKSLIASRPVWATGGFAIAVFVGAFGDMLLLLKKAFAYYLFIASFLGVLVTSIHTFQVTSAVDIWVGSMMSFAVAGFLIWYSKLVQRKGWVN